MIWIIIPHWIVIICPSIKQLNSTYIDWKMQVEELMNKKNVLKNGWKLIIDFYQEKTGKEVADLNKDF